jgi:Bacterial regulatory proteins, luxR family
VRQGLTDRQIAKQMFLSVRTVEGHMENLRGKLGVNTRASVAAWAAVNLRPKLKIVLVRRNLRVLQTEGGRADCQESMRLPI